MIPDPGSFDRALACTLAFVLGVYVIICLVAVATS